MLLLCISEGNPGIHTPPIAGRVYRLLGTFKYKTYIPTGTDKWYKIDDGTNCRHHHSLFEELPEDMLTNLQGEKVEDKLKEISLV